MEVERHSPLEAEHFFRPIPYDPADDVPMQLAEPVLHLPQLLISSISLYDSTSTSSPESASPPAQLSPPYAAPAVAPPPLPAASRPGSSLQALQRPDSVPALRLPADGDPRRRSAGAPPVARERTPRELVEEALSLDQAEAELEEVLSNSARQPPAPPPSFRCAAPLPDPSSPAAARGATEAVGEHGAGAAPGQAGSGGGGGGGGGGAVGGGAGFQVPRLRLERLVQVKEQVLRQEINAECLSPDRSKAIANFVSPRTAFVRAARTRAHSSLADVHSGYAPS